MNCTPLSSLDVAPKPGDKVGYWFAPNGTKVVNVWKYDGGMPDLFTHWVELETRTPGKTTIVPFNAGEPPLQPV